MAKPIESSIVTKCGVVIDVIAEARHPLTFAEIVARTGFVKSSTHRILSILQGEEMLQYDQATRTYSTGPRLRRWARSSWHRADLQDAATGPMEVLCDTTGFNTALSILDDQNILYLRTSDYSTIQLAARAGDRAPLHCTAAGKVFLANMGSRRQEEALTSLPLEKFTEFTMTDARDLRAEFPRILQNGYALALKEEYHHVIGCAAPIRDSQGTIAACLSLWALTSTTSVEDLKAHLPSLVNAAETISGHIGWDVRP